MTAAGLAGLAEGLPAAARETAARVIGLLDSPFAAAVQAFAEVLGFLDGPAAAGLEAGEAEEYLLAAVRDGGRKALQGFLDRRAERERRLPRVTGSDGVARTRAEKDRARALGSSLGDVTVRRIAYRRPRGRAGGGLKAADLHPADGQLGLPPGRDSWPLQKLTVTHAARGSYQDAASAVQLATGQKVGKRQAEAMMIAAAADYEGFYQARRPPPGAPPGTVLGMECDAKGIMMRPGHLRPAAARQARRSQPRQDGRLSRGEVRNRKRMAETAAVFDIRPAPRAPGDILPPPGPRPAPAARPPRAERKWVTASVEHDAATVVAAMFAEADRRDPRRERTWIALADGNIHQLAWIQAEAATRGVTVTIVIDFIHVIEYLWKAAWCLFPEASPDAGPWVRRHGAAILGGGARAAAAAIRAQAALVTGMSKAKRKAIATTVAYLEAKAPWLAYPAALAAGWPISSGVIEGTCRYLVKDRMDITGARWTVNGAEAVLKIRSLIANGDFDDYWDWHLHQERKRNHDNRYANATIPQAA